MSMSLLLCVELAFGGAFIVSLAEIMAWPMLKLEDWPPRHVVTAALIVLAVTGMTGADKTTLPACIMMAVGGLVYHGLVAMSDRVINNHPMPEGSRQ